MAEKFRHIYQAVHVILGQHELSTNLALNLKDESTFVAVESKRRGYRIEKKGQEIVIKRANLLSLAAGLPPLFYFQGKLQPAGDKVVLSGQVLMSAAPKFFILTWLSLMLFALTVTFAWVIVQSAVFMISPSSDILPGLKTGGFLIGGFLGLSAFGCFVIVLIRLMSSYQKKALIVFCEGKRTVG